MISLMRALSPYDRECHQKYRAAPVTAEVASIRENPFGNSTDPRLAYFDMPRRNAVARLLTGLYQGEGLFLLIGEDGIGKSTLLCHLGMQVAALAGVRLLHTAPLLRCPQTAGFAELVDRFGAPFNAAGGDPLHLARLLQDLTAAGEQMPAMLIDDADRLDDSSLKAIATLATLRGGERRLLSAVLAGTPQLSRRVAAVSGAEGALAATQVISLMPMSRAEAERMIRHRVRQACGSDLEEALAPQISDLAGRCNGIPLQVLGLCRRVLDISVAPVPRLPLPAVAPVPAASGDGIVPAARGTPAVAPGGIDAVVSADPPVITAAGPGAVAPQASAWPSAVASAGGTTPQQAFPGFADAAGPAAGVQPPGDSLLEASGHIRYTAASARRVEPARWENARRRRRSGWRIALLSATALVGLGVGWALYDRSHIGTVDSPSARDAARDPASMAALPSPLTPSLVPPLDSPPARVGASPVLPGASTAETWWKPPPAGERLSDGQGAPSALSDATPRDPAPIVPSGGQLGPTNNSAAEAADSSAAAFASSSPARPPVPATESGAVAQTPAPAIPPRPVPKTSPPVVPPQHVDNTTRAAGKAVETAELPPVRQAESKPSPRGRQGAALLMEGDEYFSAGDIKAARAIYQEAADQGSAEAARRLAQTFDPRNVAATSRDASAAEAILWYKDAARRGDRRARGELEGLETWLEDAAASGNAEAQRVLQTWRSASTEGARGHSSAEP